jgi:hypothetical protein
MVAVAGLLLQVIGWQWTTNLQAAGHDHGPVDPGGYAPTASQIHALRVPKARTMKSIHP